MGLQPATWGAPHTQRKVKWAPFVEAAAVPKLPREVLPVISSETKEKTFLRCWRQSILPSASSLTEAKEVAVTVGYY